MQTKEELTADRAALVSARTSLLTGQAVKEFWRDGRRVVYQSITVANINDAIADIDAQLCALDAPSAGALPRFRAMRVRFGGGC